MEVIDMSATYSLSLLTEPERDMLVWYRLGHDPDFSSYRPIAASPISREPLADDTPAESIQTPKAA
jgi:hypothetical protein